MSRADLSAGLAVRASGQGIDTAPRSGPAGSRASTGFPDLLRKMAAAGSRSPGQPAISTTEPRRTWDRDAPQSVPALDEKTDGALLLPTAVPDGESGSAASIKDQPSAAQPSAAPSSDDMTMTPTDLASPLPGGTPGPVAASIDAGVVSGAPVGQDTFAFGQVPLPLAGIAVLKETRGDAQARGVGAPQDTREKRDGSALPQATTTGSFTPKAMPQDLGAVDDGSAAAAHLVSVVAQETHIAPVAQPWSAHQGLHAVNGSAAAAQPVSGGAQETHIATVVQPSPVQQDLRAAVDASAAATQLASVAAQETHSAPIVQPWPVQGARYRSERAAVADAGMAPAQGTEAVDAGPLAPRVDAPMGAKPLRPAPDLPALAARPTNEEDIAGDGDREIASPAPSADRAVSGSVNELSHAAGGVASPAHQVAGQIVATALAVRQEEAQPIGTLAAKSPSPPVVKILRLELQPADLGTITIRMSLRQDALDIRVEASRYDTARLLQRDQDSLAKLITGAGYRIDGMAVVAAVADGAGVADGRSQTLLPSSTLSHWGSSQQDSRSSGGRPNAEPDPRSSRGKQNDDHDKRRPARGAGGDLYV